VSHTTHINESCHTYKRVTSHTSLLVSLPCHTYEWAVSQIWMSHIPRMIETCLLHIRMSHVTHTNKTRHTSYIFGIYIQLEYIRIIFNYISPMNETPDTYKWVIYSCMIVIYLNIHYVWISHVRHHIYSKYI